MNVHTRFFRSRNEAMVAGVASGIARGLGIEAWLVRLIFLMLVIGFGTGVLAYFVLWFIMPIEPEGIIIYPNQFDRGEINQRRAMVGGILMLIGAYLLVTLVFGPRIWVWALPIALIIGGILLFGSKKS
ncbi:MAG: PspC domain-containing protein [Chloroflexi bacterium]|nr:PspC domain-containing protein [Chloroflexota bacterium]